MDELSFIRAPRCISQILERTRQIGFEMASQVRTGAFLRALAASKPNGRFLELGTGTGVATAWLLDGMDADSTLVSLDTDARVQAVAREALDCDRRLSLVVEGAVSFLQRQPQGSFDLVFADALAGKYEALEDALRVVRAGGFYVVDDLLPQANWPEGHADKVPALMRKLASQAGFTVVPMSWASGLCVAVRFA